MDITCVDGFAGDGEDAALWATNDCIIDDKLSTWAFTRKLIAERRISRNRETANIVANTNAFLAMTTWIS